MKSILVKLKNISKRYNDILALNNVSVEIMKSSIVGFIGADGAGKSTLMKIMLTLEKMDSGEGQLFGMDITKSRSLIRSRIGYMPEVFSLYPDLSVQENLNFFFRIYKLPVEQYEEKMNWLYKFNRLDNFRDTLAGQLSGGMKQKLALSCALMNDPELLVLDEPTTGVDPVSRNEFWMMLRSLKESGKGIVISTPYLDEAMQCDYIYLFHKGQILAEGAPQEIINKFPANFLSIRSDDPYSTLYQLTHRWPDIQAYLIGEEIHVVLSESDISQIKPNLAQFGEVYPIQPGLEDIFLNLLKSENKGNYQ